jgi:hypothetical protein
MVARNVVIPAITSVLFEVVDMGILHSVALAAHGWYESFFVAHLQFSA